jgi:Secretion system C-terminal sorting domain
MKIWRIKTSILAIMLLCFILPFQSKAQVNVEWSNEPGGVALAVDQLHHIYSANWDYNPAGDITITKRTADGNVLWNTTFNNTDTTRHEVVTWLETDSQNNCLVAGTIRSGYSNPVNAASILMKFDSDGNLLWRNVFESSFEGSYTRKILVDNADNIYVLGLGTGPNGQVTRVKKFDANGTPIWTYYDTNGIGAPINIKFTPDNFLLVSGRGITGIINGYLKLSLTGNLIWSKSGIISATIGDASGDSLGNTYIINGENVVSNAGSILEKVDPNGLLLWSHTNSMAGSKVETGTDNNPIISGFPNTSSGGAAFMKYDATGTVLWQNLNADGPEILLLHGVLQLDAFNNAYLSAGNLFNMAVCKINSDGTNGWVGLVSGSNSAKSFVLDTDNSIYIIGTTTAKLSEISLGINNPNNSDFIITPNPITDQLNIVTQNDIREKKVTLFSINGAIIFESTFSGNSKTIELINIESGLYILTIMNQNGLVHKQKIIKR